MSRHKRAAPVRRRPAAGLAAAPGHLTSRLCRPGVAGCSLVEPDRLARVIEDPEAVLWVDVRDPADEDLQLLRQAFDFHGLALEDVAKQQQRPKVDEYPDYYFVVLYAPLPTEDLGAVHVTELDLFIGRNYLVTVHRGEVPALAEAAGRWERTDVDLRRDIGFLVHTVMDAVVDGYFPIVDRIEDRLDDLELALYEADGGTSPEELLAVKRSLFTLRKAIYPTREVFNAFLSRDSKLFTVATLPYFQDVYDHVLRLLDTIEIQRDVATGTLDAHLAVVSNRLNDTMKRLTMVGICVAIMGAVFGAWGMNFDRVPMAHHPGGFWVVSVGVAALVAGALLWARRRL
jgi:magnesium transporter